MFNIVDTTGGGKIDFWIFKHEDFNVSRFERKYEENILGFKMNVSAPEDTILAKLHWIKKYVKVKSILYMHCVFMNCNSMCLIKSILMNGQKNCRWKICLKN